MAGSSSEIERVEETESVDNETLMNCIQNYRCLYDKGCKDYKVPLKKRNAWKGDRCKVGESRWKKRRSGTTISAQFFRSISSAWPVQRSGSGRNDVPELRKDMEHLRWLIVHIKHRRGTDNPQKKENRRVANSWIRSRRRKHGWFKRGVRGSYWSTWPNIFGWTWILLAQYLNSRWRVSWGRQPYQYKWFKFCRKSRRWIKLCLRIIPTSASGRFS